MFYTLCAILFIFLTSNGNVMFCFLDVNFEIFSPLLTDNIIMISCQD